MTEHTPGATISPQEHAVSILRVYVDHFDNPESPMALPRGVLEDVVNRVDHLHSSRNNLLVALRAANAELACLVADPEDPDFNPVTTNKNTADAECLTVAFSAIREALANIKGETS